MIVKGYIVVLSFLDCFFVQCWIFHDRNIMEKHQKATFLNYQQHFLEKRYTDKVLRGSY